MASWPPGEIPGDWSNTRQVTELRPIRDALDKWLTDHETDIPDEVKEAVDEAASSLEEAADLMVGPYEPQPTTDENAATTEESGEDV